jgi:hypothetical protein
MMLRNGPSTKEMNAMKNSMFQKFGAALAIFVTAGIAGEAQAEAQAAATQPPAAQIAAPADTATMSGVHRTMTTASAAMDAATMDAAPRAQRPRSMPNAHAAQNAFPDNPGFEKWWVGD